VTLLNQAEALIKAATQPGGVKRDAAKRWWSTLQQAQGEEAEQIAFMGEALLVAARGPVEQEWVDALISGGPKEADAVEDRMKMRQAAQRSDAQESDDGIDWANVASEAAVMLELNKEAMKLWESKQQAEES
jgi:hypothetical protein